MCLCLCPGVFCLMPALLLVHSAAHSLQEHLERSVFFDDNKRRIGRLTLQYIVS